MDMVTKLKSFRNGVHGQFFLEVAAELERLQQESAVKVTCATHGTRTFGLCSACVNANEARKALEGGSEVDVLMAAFDAALDSHPFLLIEIGYTRITDWMVTIWDAAGTSIKDAPKVVQAQEPSRAEACRVAIEQLRARYPVSEAVRP